MEIQDLQQLFIPSEFNMMSNMNTSEVEQVTHQQSQLILEKTNQAMRRKTLISLVVGLLACALAPIFYLDPEEDFLLDQFLSPLEMTLMCTLMGLLVLVMAFQNWYARRQILRLQRSSTDVRNGLLETIRILKYSQNVKINSDAIGLPILQAGYYLVFTTPLVGN